MSARFAVLGTTNVDLLIQAPRRAVRDGDEFTGESLVFCDEPLAVLLGGNGGNAAYVLARLGAAVQLCAALGRDALGDLAEGWLREAGVGLEGLVRHTSAATSTTTIIADAEHNRYAYHHRGAMGLYEPGDLDPALVESVDVLLVASYPLLRGWPPEALGELLQQAVAGGALTVLDIGPAIDPPAVLERLAPVVPYVDVLTCNAHELNVLTGTSQLEKGVERVWAKTPAALLLKRGRAGVTYYAPEAPPLTVPGFAVDARSTVGAGDSFNAGFLYGLGRGWAMPDVLRFACAVAALVVASEQGVLTSPTREAVDAFLRG